MRRSRFLMPSLIVAGLATGFASGSPQAAEPPSSGPEAMAGPAMGRLGPWNPPQPPRPPQAQPGPQRPLPPAGPVPPQPRGPAVRPAPYNTRFPVVRPPSRSSGSVPTSVIPAASATGPNTTETGEPRDAQTPRAPAEIPPPSEPPETGSTPVPEPMPEATEEQATASIPPDTESPPAREVPEAPEVAQSSRAAATPPAAEATPPEPPSARAAARAPQPAAEVPAAGTEPDGPAPAAPTASTARPETVVDVRESAVGPILTDPAGRTLYTYKLDVRGLSTCVGPCAEGWPPFTPAEAGLEPAAPLSLIERSDGRSQWALKGRPLYRYSGDEEPGAVQGDRFAPWSVARPGLAE